MRFRIERNPIPVHVHNIYSLDSGQWIVLNFIENRSIDDKDKDDRHDDNDDEGCIPSIILQEEKNTFIGFVHILSFVE